MSDQEPERPDDLGFELPTAAPLGKTRVLALVAVGVTIILAAFVIGYLPKRKQRQELAAAVATDQQRAPRVEVVTPKALPGARTLSLPGSIQALEETIIYPRADGYVRRWLVDIGDKVKPGQLLAEIDMPDLDKELSQARAQLAQAKAQVAQGQANRALSQVNLERYQQLGDRKLVAPSDLDQRKAQADADVANVMAAQSNVAAQGANVGRLEQLKAFTRVTAPFGGTITVRSVERGALVNGQSPLFRLAATDPVRVFVQVPQGLAPSVRAEQPAQVNVREYPTRPFIGTVVRSAGALDPLVRTMTTEVRVPNPSAELFPGMYAQVTLTLPSPFQVYEIPATALYNDARGVRVAVVDASGKIAFRPVTITRDTGATIEIVNGLGGDEQVVKLANSSLVEGAAVAVAEPPPAKKDEKK